MPDKSVVDIINKINEVILNPIILLLFVVATLVFFYGIFVMIANSTSEEGRETGRKNIMYGLIGMFIMMSVFGIVKLVMVTFGLPSSGYLF